MNYETTLRLGFFFGIFALVALMELIIPRRPLTTPKNSRWFSNLGITFLDTIIARMIFPVLPVSLAMMLQKNNLGMLNNVTMPNIIEVLLGVIILDFAIYIQHIMFHAVPIFWRLHMIHHADLDYDVTTGLRFHPIEIILSMIIKLAVVTLIGAPVMSVIIFEITLNAMSMFNHGNINIPFGIDRILRLFVVTPDMHRVHHSVVIRESNSNFGFNLSLWDHLLGTYRNHPAAGHDAMTIGLAQFRDARRLTLPWLIALPFVGKQGEYAINRRGRDGDSL